VATYFSCVVRGDDDANRKWSARDPAMGKCSTGFRQSLMVLNVLPRILDRSYGLRILEHQLGQWVPALLQSQSPYGLVSLAFEA